MVETIDFYIPDKNMNKYPKFLDAIQAPLINHVQKAASFFCFDLLFECLQTIRIVHKTFERTN